MVRLPTAGGTLFQSKGNVGCRRGAAHRCRDVSLVEGNGAAAQYILAGCLPIGRGISPPAGGGNVRLRGGRTRGETPKVSPLLRITPFPSGRAARVKVKYLFAAATQSAGSEQPFRHAPQNPPRHSPPTGCTHLSGGKRQYHLRGSPSASAPRFSFAAVPVGSRGAARPGLRDHTKGKRVIGKREKTAGCFPLARLRRAAARSPALGKRLPAVGTAHPQRGGLRCTAAR